MNGTSQNSLDQLIALTSIQHLKARYCRYIDTKQWDALLGLFSKDAYFEGFGSAPDGSNPETFVQGVAKRLKDAISIHHCHTPEITCLSDGRARGVWQMQDYLQWPHAIQLKEMPEANGFVGYGYYEEEYLRINGEWKMHFLRLTRLRIDPLPIGSIFPSGQALNQPNSSWLEGL